MTAVIATRPRIPDVFFAGSFQPSDHDRRPSRFSFRIEYGTEEPSVLLSVHDKDYVSPAKDGVIDNHLWESFKKNDAFYRPGTTKIDGASSPEQTIYRPYPKYNDQSWRDEWAGHFEPCLGPRGRYLNDSKDDSVFVYPGLPEGFPAPIYGSYKAVGLDGAHCFDSYSRLGAYGYGENETGVSNWQKPSFVSWNAVKWGTLQDACKQRNHDRYDNSTVSHSAASNSSAPNSTVPFSGSGLAKRPSFKPRTAVLLRSFEGYDYSESDIQNMRALVSELALQSGGEYQVYLLVEVKTYDAGIFENTTRRAEYLSDFVPIEFRDMTVLWSTKFFEIMYPKTGDWSIFNHQYMSVQWFWKDHPEFAYFWNVEMDMRYTGHYYHFLEQVAAFAKGQARKYLWERSARFYIPEVHGSWDHYAKMVEQWYPAEKSIWGPVKISDVRGATVSPPHKFEDDTYSWGVGEEADLVVLSPVFNATRSTWALAGIVRNFTEGESTHRTASSHTFLRLSVRMLQAMEEMTQDGLFMASEMWPTSVAEFHGFKVVYAPHPVFADRHWDPRYVDEVFNAGPVDNPGGDNRSVFSMAAEVNFRGCSYYYQSHFPEPLYLRWLAWDRHFGNPLWRWLGWSRNSEKGGKRMCLPGMLLHPIKHATDERV
ncbi:MAG: hypothetical protein M1837_002470 [Sclerophora amabilis]|nr:MAG: hypothetical protein M1837_002470 [Sclerophora amabilis]